MSKVEHSTDSNCKWNKQAKNAFCKNTEEHYIYTLKSWRPTQLATIAYSSSPGEKRRDGIGESTFNDFQSAFNDNQKRTCGVDGYSRWRWKLGRIFRLDDTWTYTTQRFFWFFQLDFSFPFNSISFNTDNAQILPYSTASVAEFFAAVSPICVQSAYSIPLNRSQNISFTIFFSSILNRRQHSIQSGNWIETESNVPPFSQRNPNFFTAIFVQSRLFSHDQIKPNNFCFPIF